MWTYDIANGMKFLMEANIMHGDLAARNIMLDENPLLNGYPVAKVADFGLSKNFYESHNECLFRVLVIFTFSIVTFSIIVSCSRLTTYKIIRSVYFSK